MVDSTTTADEKHPLQEEYPEIDAELIPLMEQPAEWFQEIVGQYGTAFGPFADICELTPDAAIFQFVGRQKQYDMEKHEFHQRIGVDKSTASVSDKQAAKLLSQPAAWINFSHPNFVYYERVPFNDQPITTVDGLRDELDEIMHETPDWEPLFAEVQSVADQMNWGE